MMALAAAVACPPRSWLCSGLGSSWLPLFQGCPFPSAWSARSDRCEFCEIPNRRTVTRNRRLARCSADALRSRNILQRSAGRCDFPAVFRRPRPPEVCKKSWEAYKSGAFDGLTCLVRLLSQFTLGVDLPSAATEDGETHSSIMFKLRERDGLHEPYRCNTKAHRCQLFTCEIAE